MLLRKRSRVICFVLYVVFFCSLNSLSCPLILMIPFKHSLHTFFFFFWMFHNFGISSCFQTAGSVGKKLNKELLKVLKKEESESSLNKEKIGFLLQQKNSKLYASQLKNSDSLVTTNALQQHHTSIGHDRAIMGPSLERTYMNHQ